MVYVTWRHSQGLSNNPIPSRITKFLVLIPTSLRYILKLASHLPLGLPKDLFLVGLPDKSLKVLLPSYILAT